MHLAQERRRGHYQGLPRARGRHGRVHIRVQSGKTTEDDTVELEVNSDGEIADANVARRNSRDSTLSSGRDGKKLPAGGRRRSSHGAGSDDPHKQSVDMGRVESALRKIKSRSDVRPPGEEGRQVGAEGQVLRTWLLS